MEHSVQRKIEMMPEVSSSDTQAGRMVDEKISDIIRMTVATCLIVLQSEGAPHEYGVRMQDRVLRMLGVKERRS